MINNFPYLKNFTFLKNFNKIKLKQQFAKIIILTFDEKPIQQIQGRITGGNFTLDGSSSMRRTGNLSMIADEYENDLTDTKHLLSINKKVEVLIGFINNTNEYPDFPILWFPQGVYVIINPNITHNNNGINISLTLHDKMALLNGECGGVFPASVILNEVEDIDEHGDIQIKQPTIYQIIQELVNHFGGQQLGKIIISDIDNRIKKVMKWTGSTPLYLCKEITKDGMISNSFSTNIEDFKQVKEKSIESFSYGEDIGYILTDFVYPSELIANAGDTVVTILDKIKNTLGNYEYFYDVNGNFIFQEIKNYLNTSYSTVLINQMNVDNYISDYVTGKSAYVFENGDIIQSYTNAPQYQQIKNDFIVWGKRKTITGQEVPIRYHLAIDKKPEINNTYNVILFKDENEIERAQKPIELNFEDFPKKGEVGYYYLDNKTNKIYKWNPEILDYEQAAFLIKQFLNQVILISFQILQIQPQRFQNLMLITLEEGQLLLLMIQLIVFLNLIIQIQ